MSLYVSYRGYSHQVGECEVVISRQGVFERGICTKITERWTIKATINIVDGETIADITSRISAMETAYSVNGGDVALVGSAHSLISANCLGGTRVVSPPSFPEGDGTEYATVRTVTIVVEGDILRVDAIGGLSEWSETLEFAGGGPRWVMIETRTGDPERQQTSQRTPYRVRQSGRAVGITQWPVIPNPIWPQHEHQERRIVLTGSPERIGANFTNWPVTWSYEFESSIGLSGVPTTA